MQKKEQRQRSVLIIDDKAEDIELIKKEFASLEGAPMLHVVKNSEEGLALLTASKRVLPDLILLDVDTPKLNGFEFLRIIKSYHSLSNIKVYLMSSSGEEYENIRASKFGARGYLVKPFGFSQDTVDVNKLKKDLE